MTPDDKDEIDRQIKNFFTSQFKIYSEVSSIVGGWKVGVWALGVLVSVATIFGITKWIEIDNFLEKQRTQLDQLVDERVAGRAAKFDDLYLASTLATNGQYQEAYSQLVSFLNRFPNLSTAGIRSLMLSNTQQDFLFSTALSILSQNYQKSANGFVGSQLWDTITSSREFLDKMETDDNWRTNHKVNYQLGIGTIKFRRGPEQLKRADRYFNMALSHATEPADKSRININLFFTALVEKRPEEAVSFGLSANSSMKDSLTPASYQERDGHWSAWEEFASAIGVDLNDSFQKAMEAMTSAQAKKEVGDKIKQIQTIDPSFSQEAFEMATQTLFMKIFTAYLSGDLKTLKDRTTLSVFATFASLINARQSRGEIQSIHIDKFDEISILDVRSSPGYVIVDVRLLTEQVQATLNRKREVIDGDQKYAQTFTDVWTVQRKVGAPMASLVVANMQ